MNAQSQTLQAKVKLQVNPTGAWRNVMDFDVAEIERVKRQAGQLFCLDLGARLRIIGSGDTAPLMDWSAKTGWRMWRDHSPAADPQTTSSAGPVLTCVYCGHEYPQDTPAAGSQVLTEHINLCEKHPLHQARKDITLLRAAVGNLIGAHTADRLCQLQAIFEDMPLLATETAGILSAIHALLATMPPEVSHGN